MYNQYSVMNTAGAIGAIGHSGMQVGAVNNVVQFAPPSVREFLPQISEEQLAKIKKELHGMIGQRVNLNDDEIVQIRRAVNIHLEDPNVVIREAMQRNRIVAVLSSEPAVGGPVVAALREGGATHLAMNLPKIFQPALDHYSATGNRAVLNQLLKHRGFKHPISLFESAISCGLQLVAVGDQQMYEGERRASSIESVAIDVSNILDQSQVRKVILWAGHRYLERSFDKKIVQSSLDYLSLNHKIYTVHNGNYIVDGGPLRKIVFDLQCPGALLTGKTKLIDNLPTGVDGSRYSDWDAILLQPRPAKDLSYFLTND